jgi:hypothetical protein
MTCTCKRKYLYDLGIDIRVAHPVDGPDKDGWALYVGGSAWWESISYCPLCGGSLVDRWESPTK